MDRALYHLPQRAFRSPGPVAATAFARASRYGRVAQAKTGILDYFLQSYLDHDEEIADPFPRLGDG